MQNRLACSRLRCLVFAAVPLLFVVCGCKTDVGRVVDNVEDYVDSCEELTVALDEVEGPESAAEAAKKVDEHIARVAELNREGAEINPSQEQMKKIIQEVDEMNIEAVHDRLISAAQRALARTNNDPTLARSLSRLAGTGFQFRGNDVVND